MNQSSRIQEAFEKEQFWKKVIKEAEGRDGSIRKFCESRGLRDDQFHWWKRKISGNPYRKKKKPEGSSFALVVDENTQGGIELILEGGRRLKIGQGVDARTLATVISVLEGSPC